MAHGHVTAAFPTFEAAADVAFFMTRADAANVLPLHRVADPVSPPRPCRFDSCARTGLVMKLHAGSLRRKRGIRKGIANGATCRFGSGRPGSADACRHSRQPGNPEGRPRCVRQRRAGARLHRESVRRVRIVRRRPSGQATRFDRGLQCPLRVMYVPPAWRRILAVSHVVVPSEIHDTRTHPHPIGRHRGPRGKSAGRRTSVGHREAALLLNRALSAGQTVDRTICNSRGERPFRRAGPGAVPCLRRHGSREFQGHDGRGDRRRRIEFFRRRT